MGFQSGKLINPSEDDPTFDTYSKAVLHVTNDSERAPMGVWTSQEEGSELIAIIWNREAYTA